MGLRRFVGFYVSVFIMLPLTFFMESCAEEIIGETAYFSHDGERMSFSVQTNNTWQRANARSQSDSAMAPGMIAMHNTEGGEMLLRYSSTREFKSPESKRGSLTRGMPVGTVYSNRFGLSMMAFEKEKNWTTANTKVEFMDNMEISKDVGEDYYAPKVSGNTPNYYWPSQDYKLSLFGYSPYGIEVLSIEKDANNIPRLHYRVPSSVASQYDVLVASKEVEGGQFSSPYPLMFNHALTAVQFAVGNMAPCEVVKIEVTGVYGEGVYNFPKSSSTDDVEKVGGWTTIGNRNATYTIEPAYQTTGTGDNAALVITGTDSNGNSRKTDLTMLMIPQKLSDDARLAVTLRFTDKYTQEKTDVVYIANIGNFEKDWNPGCTVTYTLQTSDLNDILIAENPDPFEYNSQATDFHTFYVESTTWEKSAVSTAVSWTAQFVDPQTGNTISQPSWISSCETNYSGSSHAYYAKVSVNPHSSSANTTHTSYMQSSAQRGNTVNYWDLSSQDYSENNDVVVNNAKSRNTANCYIISHPGYYKFPLVYGNAIKNGATNSRAYTSIYSGDYILTNFVRHDNQPIVDPWIRNNGFTPTSATLLWQDQMGLIQNLVIEGDYVKFYVASNRICQGNALIGVKDAGGNILWSWHIWFTDADMNSTVNIHNRTGYQYQLTPVCLGWTSGVATTDYYPSESVILRITNSNGKTADITIRQNSYFTSSNTNGGVLVYQWGRKDPFVTANNNKGDNNEKVVYDINNNQIQNPVSKVAATGKIGDAIANPMTFYTSSGDWLGNVEGEIEEPDKHFWNLWSANSNVTTANDFAVVKTVYDPCPAGFCLPPSNAFTGFTDDGLDHGAWNIFDDRAKDTDGTTLLPANNVTYNSISYNIDNSHFNIDPSISPSTNGYDGGWQFYCGTAENGIWKMGERLFMVTICERTCAGNLNVGTYGHYWTAVAGPYPEYYDNQEAYDLTVNNQKVTLRTRSQSKAYNARFLFFTPNYVDPVDNQRGAGRSHNKGFGWNVWPVKEKEGW